MDKLGVGIIGLGVGLGHMQGYEADPRCRVVAICDIDESKLLRVKEERGVPFATTRWQALVDRDDVDIVSICTPDSLHTEQTLAALSAGKHVLVEKPMATTLEDVTAIVKAVEKTRRKLASNLVLRYAPRFREVKRLAESGFFGEIFYAEGDYLHPLRDRLVNHWRAKERYNIQLGGAVHLIDLLHWIVDDEITEVFAYGNRKCYRPEEFPYHDNIVQLLQFRNGCVGKAQTAVGVNRPHFHNMILHGTRASFYNTDQGPAKLYCGETHESVYLMNHPYPAYSKGALVSHLIDCILEDKEPLVNVYEAARTCAVCIAGMESIESGGPVKVRYPWREGDGG